MKKTSKVIALVMAIAIVALSLCSCRSLDNLKQNQAFYLDNTKTEITLHGNIYRELKLGKLSFIDARNYESQGDGCYITEKGVPALLSSWYGDWYSINHDESVISTFGNHYVREDKYELVHEAVNGAVLDHVYISYYPNTYYSASYEGIDIDHYDIDHVSNVLLEQDVTDTINKALSTPENDKVKLTEKTLQSVDALMIERCDKNMMVTTFDNNSVVLLRNGENFYVIDDSYYWADEYNVCPIDKDGAVLIKELFEKYPEAVDQTAF